MATRKTNMAIVAICVASLTVMTGCSGCSGKKTGSHKPAGQTGAANTLSPDSLEYEAMNGKTLNIGRESAGKPIFVTFFASWCAVCAEEVPEINKLYEKYGADGVIAVYAVNVGDSRKKVESLITERGMKYPVLLDEKLISQDKFDLMGLPLNIVFDRDGKEIYRGPGLPEEDMLAKALAN